MQKHESSESEKLLLIKASAGSGKTHRLTGEYLRLLFDAENNYRHILAVTFTNKATDEMKSRIVKELFSLSNGDKSEYLSMLYEKTLLPEKTIREKARQILENILHDYSAFSVSTIDRFFQQTMRAFTREMGLSGGYKLEIDQSATLSQIIDLMILELNNADSKKLTEWILSYMKSRIEQGRTWNIRELIGNLANELFNEEYKLFSKNDKEKIHDKTNLENYRLKLEKIVSQWENQLIAVGKQALSLMDRFNLDFGDFKGGRNSGLMIFVKLANGEVKKPSDSFYKKADNLDEWFGSKKNKHSDIQSAFYAGLNDCVKQTVGLFGDTLFYQTAKSILKNYYTLGILNDIRRRLREYQRENDMLFLSDATELLNKIIEESESPFVYEKTGTRIEHYMIDEFQDTSAMQWRNFRPLVRESLAKGRFNLIVGDVKQSIFRWRNSDWRLLEQQVPKDLEERFVETEILNTNWRSEPQIIRFNNSFFKTASRLLQQTFDSIVSSRNRWETVITDAYRHVFQEVSPNKTTDAGHLKITFLGNAVQKEDWQAEALEKLPQEIEKLQDRGFSLKDIAILVRKNNEATVVAEKLLQYAQANRNSKYRYDFTSTEALIIGNSPSVKSVIALFRYFQNRDNEIIRMIAVYEFYRFHKHLMPQEAIGSFFNNMRNDFSDELKTKLFQIASLPFYEMVESFFAMSDNAIDSSEIVYVQSFMDIVLQYSTQVSSNINDFLQWWDDKGCKKTLQSMGEQDAISILTIHKAKGLGFGAVIMPFLSWEIDHKGNNSEILWCRPNTAPFNEINVIPVLYRKELEETIFHQEYFEEKVFTYLDNINLLYVAFTRAKDTITAFAPMPKRDDIKDISSLTWKVLQDNPENNFAQFIREEAGNQIFEYGKPEQTINKKGTPEIKKIDSGRWQSIPFHNRLRLRLNSTGFFSDNGKREYGIMMHEIVSSINRLDDLDNAVERRFLAGEITADEKNEISKMLKEALSNDTVKEWYSGKYQVLNETQLLRPDLNTSRPDRIMLDAGNVVVVDYKFGDTEEKKYIRQIQNYVKIIREMGFEQVKGYVFYVKQNKVIDVNGQ